MLQELLQQYWGYTSFRPLQEEIITAVVGGKDTFALLPTGGGKSVCYQLPAIAQDGFCLVISPLIALMQDQVLQLTQRGIAAAYIHSGMNARQVNDVLYAAQKGAYKLLYVSPERLQTDLFQEYASGFNLNLIAVDEAHCISQWGHDFRPAYRKIDTLRTLFPRIPMLALTASANEKVQLDIMQQLQLKAPQIFRQSIVRNNLFYHIRYTENKPGDASRLFSSVKGSGIVYCRSRKRCVETAMQLKSEGIDARVYHAGLGKEERELAQRQWTSSNSQVICATNAFGMGIDKPDVRTVAHYDTPDNLEEYYQEAGRAGRDGQKAHAVLFYNPNDIQRLHESIDIHFPPEAYIRNVYQLVGDYLKMPVGSGFEELQPFDAVAFVQTFNLETLKALSAIRLLDREGFWQWNENTGLQTQVMFTTDNETLTYLQKSEPALSYIATSLLRLYGSIFHFPTVIREYEVSRLLRIEKVQLDKGLQRLAALGIIDYQPGITGGTLYWTHDRMAPAHFRLDTTLLNQLRKAYEERVHRMVAYVQEEHICRNILLSDYFGESPGEPCGGCDACKRNAQLHNQEKGVREKVLQLIREKQQITVEELTAHFSQISQEAIIEHVRSLNDEHLCRIYPTGTIFAS